MKEKKKIDVVIVGGNHHNGLGLSRILGINGYKTNCIVIDDCKKSFLRHSKYVNSCICFKDATEALNYILEKYPKAENTVIIPYSDEAAFALDKRLKDFNKYIVPSINKKTGAIAKMMIKSEQYLFAKENNIKMAKTEEVDFNKDINSIWKSDIYPCILKPIISAEGSKKDIVICNDRYELNKSIELYNKKGYKRALLQEFLFIDYEIDVFGCILNKEPYIYFIPTKTLRSWPIKGGTNSFSQIIIDSKIKQKCFQILDKLKQSGFRGLYDIELFVINDEVYLNEINYRNSGDVYMGIKQKFYYPIYWINDCIGIKNNKETSPRNGTYAMTECADIRNVLKKKISLKEWLIDFKRTEDFALKFKGDMRPAYDKYCNYFLKFISFKKY